jgi:hypothetical protein
MRAQAGALRLKIYRCKRTSRCPAVPVLENFVGTEGVLSSGRRYVIDSDFVLEVSDPATLADWAGAGRAELALTRWTAPPGDRCAFNALILAMRLDAGTLLAARLYHTRLEATLGIATVRCVAATANVNYLRNHRSSAGWWSEYV